MSPTAPFTLTPAAVRLTVAEFAEMEEWAGGVFCGLRVTIYYVHGDGSRQYTADPLREEKIDPDDVRLDFPDGPLAVYVPRESFMRLWGYVLDVAPIVNHPEGKLGHWLRTEEEG